MDACSCGAGAGEPCRDRRTHAEILHAHTRRPRLVVKEPYVPPRERGKYTDTLPFLGTLGRMVQAAGRRVAHADMDDLRALVAIHDELEEAIRVAIAGMRDDGYSWKDIGADVFGTTGQAVYYRYGKPKAG
jgi:hypothetical protein